MMRSPSANLHAETRQSAGSVRARAATSLAAQSPEDLARRAQNGSLASFGELVDRFEGLLVGYLRRRVGAADAEDLAQETFVRAWTSIQRFDPERSFSTWLFTIASRLATDHYRATSRDRRLHEAKVNEVRVRSTSAQSNERRSQMSSMDLWEIAQGLLSEDQLGALWLRYAAEMRIEDVARAIGKSSVATRVLLFRAREKLGSAISAEERAHESERASTVSRSETSVGEVLRGVATAPGGL